MSGLLIAQGAMAEPLLTFTDWKISTQNGEFALDYDEGGLRVQFPFAVSSVPRKVNHPLGR